MVLSKVFSTVNILLTLSLVWGGLLLPSTGTPIFIQEVEAALPDLMARYNVPGVSVALLEKGQVVYLESFGYADQDNQIPMTIDTYHQVASVSKSLTAWGVMKLVDEGRIGLDEPVSRYLTRWHIPPSKYDIQGVTVRRLLNHTAGLSLEGYGRGRELDEPLPSLEASLNGDTLGAGAVRLIQKPGTTFMYSGGGYTVLQLLVEEVTGQTFNDYMESVILHPLGMEESTFVWDSMLQTRLARGYGMYNNVIPNYRYIEDAAGGLYSTPREMAQYAQVLINGSSVLSEEAFAQLFEGDTYGFGHGLIDFPSGQRMIFGGGTRMGWQSDFVVIPEDDCGIVVLANANGGVILNLILIDLWVQSKTGYAWPGAAIYLYEYPVLVAAGVILGTLCLALAWRMFSQFVRGQRSFLFRQSRKLKWLHIVCSLVVVGVMLGLWLMAVTPYIDHQQRLLWLPEPALYAGIVGTVLSALICISLLFPKHKRGYA